MRHFARTPLTLALFLAACGGSEDPDENSNSGQCPAKLPEAAVRCEAPECSSTASSPYQTKGQISLDSGIAKRWLVIQTMTHPNGSDGPGSASVSVQLKTDKRGGDLPSLHEHGHEHQHDHGHAALDEGLDPARLARFEAEQRIRAASRAAWIPPEPRSLGSQIIPLAVKGRIGPKAGCSVESPSCGDQALCMIPTDQSQGQCAGDLAIKWSGAQAGAAYDTVQAVVRKVGEYGAIVVDKTDNDSLSDADVSELLNRFDTHIAPLDHSFFGRPVDAKGRDFDGNGKVILFFTSKIADIDPNLVGFFRHTDLQKSNPASSNHADMLYLRPPGGSISLNSLSGTIGHEYQHLINAFTKRVVHDSSQEEVWLDEALACFAEDMLGYGQDAFQNIANYLKRPGDVSLTGAGQIPGSPGDSLQRRGMGHLFIRYLFEQKGGASFPDAPGQVVDKGGVAFVKGLVQSADTGLDALKAKNVQVHQSLHDFNTMVALDNAEIKNLSCNPRFQLKAPELRVPFTNFQRGLRLRSSIPVPGGSPITLSLQPAYTLSTADSPNLTWNTNIANVNVSSGTTELQIGVDRQVADLQMSIRALPLQD